MEEVSISCPFCGGEAIIDKRDYRFPDGTHALDGYSARCISCGARTCEYKTERGAVDAWNRRVERVCRMTVADNGQYRCSTCGHMQDDTYRSDKGWYSPEYCAHCGAKVVEGL